MLVIVGDRSWLYRRLKQLLLFLSTFFRFVWCRAS
ncbi:hypothetical protein TorRG33x02_305210 [Trema orientale]|uniref:Uncharacterized protein n=1 Tax=Trema orientale TaxID=63057 RepID=A0A2P5BXM4_TREOI|nr:hypothetical protein TorRG33x02_305210 [Trema orientale]